MVHNARKDQGCSDIKGCSPDGPLQGMRFPVGRGKRHEAGYAERDAEDERQCFSSGDRLCHIPPQCHGVYTARISVESYIRQIALAGKYRV